MILKFISLHIFAILLHLSCAIYSFIVQVSYEYPLNLFYSVFYFPQNNISHPYYKKYDAVSFHFPSIILIHGIVAIVTLIFHSFIYLPVHIYHADIVWDQKYFTWRWLEYAITCTLITIASNLSSGNNDFNNLIVMLSSGVVLQMFGMLIEKNKKWWRSFLFFASILEFGLGWGIFWNTLTSKNNSHAWIEFIFYGFYYSLFPLNCVRDAIIQNNFMQTEYIYNVLSLTSKFALFWLQVGELERNVSHSIWTDIEIYILGIVVPGILLVIGILSTPKQIERFKQTTKNTWFVKFIKFSLFT